MPSALDVAVRIEPLACGYRGDPEGASDLVPPVARFESFRYAVVHTGFKLPGVSDVFEKGCRSGGQLRQHRADGVAAGSVSLISHSQPSS
jgi:hypothetical protein